MTIKQIKCFKCMKVAEYYYLGVSLCQKCRNKEVVEVNKQLEEKEKLEKSLKPLTDLFKK